MSQTPPINQLTLSEIEDEQQKQFKRRVTATRQSSLLARNRSRITSMPNSPATGSRMRRKRSNSNVMPHENTKITTDMDNLPIEELTGNVNVSAMITGTFSSFHGSTGRLGSWLTFASVNKGRKNSSKSRHTHNKETTVLLPEERQLIKETWPLIKETSATRNGKNFAAECFRRLFNRRPDIALIFGAQNSDTLTVTNLMEHADFDRHTRVFTNMIDLAVKNVDELEAQAGPALITYGRRHCYKRDVVFDHATTSLFAVTIVSTVDEVLMRNPERVLPILEDCASSHELYATYKQMGNWMYYFITIHFMLSLQFHQLIIFYFPKITEKMQSNVASYIIISICILLALPWGLPMAIPQFGSYISNNNTLLASFVNPKIEAVYLTVDFAVEVCIFVPLILAITFALLFKIWCDRKAHEYLTELERDSAKLQLNLTKMVLIWSPFYCILCICYIMWFFGYDFSWIDYLFYYMTDLLICIKPYLLIFFVNKVKKLFFLFLSCGDETKFSGNKVYPAAVTKKYSTQSNKTIKKFSRPRLMSMAL